MVLGKILFVTVFCTGWPLFFLPTEGTDYFDIQAPSIIEAVGLLVAAPLLRSAVPLTVVELTLLERQGSILGSVREMQNC